MEFQTSSTEMIIKRLPGMGDVARLIADDKSANMAGLFAHLNVQGA